MGAAVKGTTVTQFRLENSSIRELRRLSKRTGISVAELLRRAAREYLDRQMGGAA